MPKTSSRNKRTPVRLRVAQHEAIEVIARKDGVDFSVALAEVIDQGLASFQGDVSNQLTSLERELLRTFRRAAAAQAATQRRILPRKTKGKS